MPSRALLAGLGILLSACDGGAGVGEQPDAEAVANRPVMAEMDMEGEAGTTVRLQPGQAEQIGLRWDEVALEPLVRVIRASAVVEYPESEMVWVSPKVSGWVERLYVTFEGAPVRKGEPLLDIYSPELVTAQEELLLARRLEDDLSVGGIISGGDSLITIARQRLAYWDISEPQVTRLLETGEVQKTLTLHSPATGVVMKKNVFEGQGVQAGENLIMISPTDPVWIEAAIYEQDLPFMKVGLPVRVSVDGLPGDLIRGRVAFLYPELREDSRTLVARIEIPNASGRLRPGMYATVHVETETETVLSVPTSAILHTGVRDIVFMDMGDSRLMPVIVRTGRSGDERIEILSGLSEGDRVATSAQFLLDSEANLMEAMQAMMTQLGRTSAGTAGRDTSRPAGRDTTSSRGRPDA